MLRNRIPEISSILLFVVSSIFATSLSLVLLSVEPSIGPTSGTSGFPYIIYYLVSAVVFSLIVIFLGRRKIAGILRWLFLGVIAYVVFYIWSIIGLFIAQTELQYYILIFAAPVIMVAFMIFKNEWYVVDAAGFFLVAGVASIWGIVIGVWASVLFLIAFAVYDYIAVYKTKHMISLANVAVNEQLPLLFVFPGEKGVKLRDIKMSEGGQKTGGQKALIIGFGDLVFPSIMVVSSAIYGQFNLIPFILFPMLGSIAGMAVLFFTSVSRPAPGLPFINTGAVAGFLLAYLIFVVLA